jgi:hypothetical protein
VRRESPSSAVYFALIGILAAGVGSTFGTLISRTPFWKVASIDSRSSRRLSGSVSEREKVPYCDSTR